MRKINTEQIVNKNIPVIFQNIEQFEKEDERFVKVKIWLMHIGENLNASVFTKESVEKAIPTLANTAILAYIEENSNGELDYSDHRMELNLDQDGEYRIKYRGQAVGIIPETNNAQWEKRVADSGEELEYLTVEGLMWTKWNDPIDIIKRKGFTAQSMELSDKYTGHFNKDGLFEFEEFKFNGACLLGSDVMPAMKNSTVEMQFSTNTDMRNIIEDKLKEFNILFSEKQGGNKELEKEKQEFEENVETTETQVDEQVVSTVETAPETSEEFTEEAQTETTEVDAIEETQETTTEEVTEEFEVEVDTTEQVETQSTVEVVDETVETEQEVNEFEVKYNELSADFEALKVELEELRTFKRKALETELSTKFEGQLSSEELAQVFEQSTLVSIEDIEKELFALVGKKNFSAITTSPTKIAVQVNKDIKNEVNEPYGGLFEKFLNK